MVEKIQASIKHWQKENFHKSVLPPHHLKEAKHLEQEYEVVQKLWIKKLKKVHSTKKDYHECCKTQRSLSFQLQNARNDPSGTVDQVSLFIDI